MKRLLTLKYDNGCYLLMEDGNKIFDIQESDLKFDSLKFYQGVYMKKTHNIELNEDNTIKSTKLGPYIFRWLNQIINTIKTNIGEDLIDEDYVVGCGGKTKIINLFDMAACAGDGLYVDSDVSKEQYETEVFEADFAVRIKGKSMEPTIPDGSIVLVKKMVEYNHNDIVIVNYNGDALCKRYVKLIRGANLISENPEGKFLEIKSNHIADCKFQGKVIAYNYNDKIKYI